MSQTRDLFNVRQFEIRSDYYVKNWDKVVRLVDFFHVHTGFILTWFRESPALLGITLTELGAFGLLDKKMPKLTWGYLGRSCLMCGMIIIIGIQICSYYH